MDGVLLNGGSCHICTSSALGVATAVNTQTGLIVIYLPEVLQHNAVLHIPVSVAGNITSLLLESVALFSRYRNPHTCITHEQSWNDKGDKTLLWCRGGRF